MNRDTNLEGKTVKYVTIKSWKMSSILYVNVISRSIVDKFYIIV